ncbi:CYTH domain-containing protein [Parashewanella curva]|uniref:CYTH domain-containing protein n=1 Tax=Parashewanella curva TaxID=2338552 RepID=A0A3L8PYW2_9GAMM|nr:CYTH domain-containing protein [Parashewanella curva]RLV60554.1 CYTH domain-containing protein [Parashewanella curva]
MNKEHKEVELKLTIPKDKHKGFIEFMGVVNHAVFVKREQLKNDYFDTSSLQLSRLKVGLRIRQADSYKEQTLKTAGEVCDGMHVRHEYNHAIEGNIPKLDLFPNLIWPDNCDVKRIQQALICLFNTNFIRHTWRVELDGSQFEVVLDDGEVASDFSGVERKIPISEVELELISGDSEALVKFAQPLIDRFKLEKCEISKAQRGYGLLEKSHKK